MDTPTLPLGFLEDGRRYLHDIEALGLRPNAFFWAFDCLTDSFVLVLVSETFDTVGPFDLSKLLFKAHNAGATPCSIDPFILRLHSCQHQIVREIGKIMPLKKGLRTTRANGLFGSENRSTQTTALMIVDGLALAAEWMYRFDMPPSKVASSEILRCWHRFEYNVDKLAA